LPPLAAPHAHGRARAGIGPAEIGRQLAVLDLPAAAFAIVVGVPSLAVGPDGARIVGVMAQLAHILDHHVQAVRVAFAEMAAAGVVRPLAAQPDRAIADVVTPLALPAEAVVLELQHGGEGEGVVGAGEVDVLRSEPGIGPENFPRVMAGDGRDRPGLVVHVGARLAAAADHAADLHQRLL